MYRRQNLSNSPGPRRRADSRCRVAGHTIVFACVATLISLLSTATAAQDPADRLIAEMREQCAPAALIAPAIPYTPIELAPDGTLIELFDQAAWDCADRPALFRHTGGGEVILRAHTPSGMIHRSFTARGWGVVDLAGHPVLLLARHAATASRPATCRAQRQSRGWRAHSSASRNRMDRN